MATSHAARSVATPSFDENDDLYNYDANLDDIFREVETTGNINGNKPFSEDAVDSGAALGIDEEIKVTKKRKPIAKLDDTRLLSQAGIPKLRRIAKAKLKLKGKGHEFTDAARLLNFYQLWLDGLYPRAKFSDGLVMIEKLGHSKRLQVMRREWIDEGKTKHPLYDSMIPMDTEENTTPKASEESTSKDLGQEDATLGNRNISNRQAEDAPEVGNRAPNARADIKEPTSIFGGGGTKTKGNELFLSDDEDEAVAEEEKEEEDGLDALLAEQDSMPDKTKQQNSGLRQTSEVEDNYDDELEAMAGFDDPW